MTKTKWMIVCLTLTGLLAAQSAIAQEKPAVVPVFKISGPLAEQPDQSGMSELFGGAASLNMYSLIETMDKVRTDDDVKAVIFDIDGAALGFAQIAELRNQIEKLKAADKTVWIFSESLSNGTLMLGSAASKLVLVPTGDVIFNGIYAEASYYKNLLDKIHIKADILHCGDYKSAGEPFYRTGPSKEAEEQMNRLLDAMFDEMIAAVAKSRSLSEEKVRSLVDKGMFSGPEALEENLVDALMYREDFVKKIKKVYGEDVNVVSDYGAKDALDVDLQSPWGVFGLFNELMKPSTDSSDTAIAVVYVEGAITSGPTEQGLFGGASNAGSDTVRRAIAEAAANEGVKALVLRVDSPGGSALASDIICEATRRFKDSGRPVIVSMGNVAGSGGYYVSTLADAIFAEPATITGSIGVVGGKIVTSGLWEWVGVTSHEYKRGERADVLNMNREFSEKERELVMSYMNRVYDQFKARVVEGRGDKLSGPIEPLAGGRVYSGKTALDIGLVDRLGGFTDAVKYAADKAELADYELRVYPRPKSLGDIFRELLGGKDAGDDFVTSGVGVRTTLRGKFATHPDIAAGLEAVQTIDPAKAKAIRQFLVQLELLGDENVLLVGPSVTTLSN